MKTSAISSLVLAAAVNAHSIFQRVSVNGADQGLLVGVRSPDSNYPVYDVTSANIACNTGIHSPVSGTVISIPAGARVGSGWGHVIGGAQYNPDPDNPIASSHHGPIQHYLAKVDNAVTSGTSGLKWFKVSSDGLNGGKWGVDNMIANGGWAYFTLPTCIAPGQYLLRAEIIALHNAYNAGGAQFYEACAQIQVTGSGSGNYSPSTTVSLPGAYPANDPGIVINIYGTSGNPDNGGKPYYPPGPPVITCASGPAPTTTTANGATTTTSKAGTATTTASGATQTHYGQCGGQGYSGPTTCASPYTCKVSSVYYSQCL